MVKKYVNPMDPMGTGRYSNHIFHQTFEVPTLRTPMGCHDGRGLSNMSSDQFTPVGWIT